MMDSNVILMTCIIIAICSTITVSQNTMTEDVPAMTAGDKSKAAKLKQDISQHQKNLIALSKRKYTDEIGALIKNEFDRTIFDINKLADILKINLFMITSHLNDIKRQYGETGRGIQFIADMYIYVNMKENMTHNEYIRHEKVTKITLNVDRLVDQIKLLNVTKQDNKEEIKKIIQKCVKNCKKKKILMKRDTDLYDFIEHLITTRSRSKDWDLESITYDIHCLNHWITKEDPFLIPINVHEIFPEMHRFSQNYNNPTNDTIKNAKSTLMRYITQFKSGFFAIYRRIPSDILSELDNAYKTIRTKKDIAKAQDAINRMIATYNKFYGELYWNYLDGHSMEPEHLTVPETNGPLAEEIRSTSVGIQYALENDNNDEIVDECKKRLLELSKLVKKLSQLETNNPPLKILAQRITNVAEKADTRGEVYKGTALVQSFLLERFYKLRQPFDYYLVVMASHIAYYFKPMFDTVELFLNSNWPEATAPADVQEIKNILRIDINDLQRELHFIEGLTWRFAANYRVRGFHEIYNQIGDIQADLRDINQDAVNIRRTYKTIVDIYEQIFKMIPEFVNKNV